MLACLARGTELIFCTDLDKLKEEMRAADPHWMLNVPLLLERMRTGIEKELGGAGGPKAWLWRRPLGRRLLAPLIRRRIAPSLKTLICGSAPLSEETQRFFMMLGLPVLQVYGLTETTAICTMDRRGAVVPGRVGSAIDGCEMKVDEKGEILERRRLEPRHLLAIGEEMIVVGEIHQRIDAGRAGRDVVGLVDLDRPAVARRAIGEIPHMCLDMRRHMGEMPGIAGHRREAGRRAHGLARADAAVAVPFVHGGGDVPRGAGLDADGGGGGDQDPDGR